MLGAASTIESLDVQSGGGLTLQGAASLTVNSNISIDLGGTMAMSGGNIYAKGDFSNAGTMSFSAGSTTASGAGNRVMTSPDGVTWTARTLPSWQYWSSVTYGNGVFVAVAGSSNVAATSP